MSAPGEAPPEDPVKRETSMTAAVLLRRSLVDKQMVDTEATIRSYEERQDDTKAQIIRRRNAQAEVYAFVNKRLEENLHGQRLLHALRVLLSTAVAHGHEQRRDVEVVRPRGRRVVELEDGLVALERLA